MNWDIVLVYAGKALLLPPGLNLLLMAVALLIGRKWRLLGVGLFGLAVLSLVALSLPITAEGLMARLQPTTAQKLSLLPPDMQNAAIVVLGGGRRSSAPEFDSADTVNARTLERLRYAARLQRQTHLPVLLSGGKPFGQATAEAVLMNDSFISDFRGAPNWLEADSRNTAENAEFSARILKANGINTIFLVTHAAHMPRAQHEFEQQGLKVLPAPTGFHQPGSGKTGPLAWLPSADALAQSSEALHEQLGQIWYGLTD
ncbi:YdcF family protein [Permianibacter sp. IMCC34836]|uniref:YdcF family protein n=1 Tax=Permianibacter fluminis TaxID=2738515 RepID=UPI001556DED4|nr:YdcF family protein [Permianibacter fluminis]NQD36625.1 YdcF family protein [Permianibacter fluminis]